MLKEGMKMKKIKVFLVDDHKLFIKGVKSILEEKEEFEIVGYACSANYMMQQLEMVTPDVILMDVNMPEMSGIELSAVVKKKYPHIKILTLTMFEDVLYVQRMIQSGVNGYILKSADLRELVVAIKKVAGGDTYLSSDIQKVLFEKMGSSDYFNEMTPAQPNKLSKREIEILSLIAREYSNGQIAEKLFISERTVETHRKNILAKTQAKSVVGLVKYALREGLIY